MRDYVKHFGKKQLCEVHKNKRLFLFKILAKTAFLFFENCDMSRFRAENVLKME